MNTERNVSSDGPLTVRATRPRPSSRPSNDIAAQAIDLRALRAASSSIGTPFIGVEGVGSRGEAGVLTTLRRNATI